MAQRRRRALIAPPAFNQGPAGFKPAGFQLNL
jgi:hypothetical protein